jgi:membrane glycosyltransferase
MIEQILRDGPAIAAPPALALRRVLFFTLAGLTIAGMIALFAFALSPGGFGFVDLVLVVLFALTLPWMALGLWNALIGLAVMRFAPDPAAAVTPAAGRVRGDEAIATSTAILACIRNEPPEGVAAYLAPLIEGLVARGVADHFHVYLLSDTGDPLIATAEEASFAALAHRWQKRIAITYRRRQENAGFKSGNIRDFCERHGRIHDFALVLDADSLMTADAVIRMVRIMQADPRLGILQSLVIGLPSTSAFARLFQFGMRLAMRSYTIGSAWWQGDCGPYWGHNAILRLAPFMDYCELPVLEHALIAGHVLSHDQIEAVLMRRAGYEVRVLTDEGGSFEQNPPTLLEFVRRDLRWCQGNMQYWHFLKMPGLQFVSRYQLVLAQLMFLGSPAWIGLLLIGTAAVAAAGASEAVIRADAGFALLALVLAMWFAPHWTSALDVLTRAPARRAFGGGVRFAIGFVAQALFVILLQPIMWFSHSMFLSRLLIGRTVGWSVQVRKDHVVPFADALNQFWPQTLAGAAVITALALSVPSAIPYALLMAGGLLFSAPLAVVTALPQVGHAMLRLGLARLPEETAPPPELHAAAIPAVALADKSRG